MNAQITIETITPQYADTLLQDKFDGQRNIRTAHAKSIASDMSSGRFHLGPDAIVLLKGKLANGQHRLEAVRISGKPQQFIVLRSTDDDLYKVIDCGMKRSVGDAFLSSPYCKHIPSIARWVLSYDDEAISPASKSAKPVIVETQIDLINYCQNNLKELSSAAAFVLPLYKKYGLMPVSISGAILFIASRLGKANQAMSFFEQVYTGEFASGKPSNDLRNRLINNAQAKARLPQGYIFGITLKALKSHINGTRPGVLKWLESEPIPNL